MINTIIKRDACCKYQALPKNTPQQEDDKNQQKNKKRKKETI